MAKTTTLRRMLRPDAKRARSEAAELAGPGALLGSRIRELRKARDLTLREVAALSGLSVGYLSQVERDRANPSIKALHDIARVLGVTIGWFFPEDHHGTEGERRYVVRANHRRTLRFESGIVDELLCPSLSGALELLMSRFEPGATSGAEPYAHKGEEAGIVVSGTLELWIDDEKFVLEEGDSFNFPSATPHRYRNSSGQETVVIWAITPPSY